MNSGDISQLCHSVGIFLKRENWQFASLPILTLEFATIGEFADARNRLILALRDIFIHPGKIENIIDDFIVEINTQGIVFRLVCKQTMMTRQGPVGAAKAQIKLYNHPPFGRQNG